MDTQGDKQFFKLNKRGRSNLYKTLKKLLHRKGPSEEHLKAWNNYENCLMIRANIGMFQYFVLNLFWLMSGRMPYQLSSDYIEDGKPHEILYVSRCFDYIMWVYIGMFLGTSVLLAVSYKYNGITKYYFYYQCVILCLHHTLPRDYGDTETQFFFWKIFEIFRSLFK